MPCYETIVAQHFQKKIYSQYHADLVGEIAVVSGIARYWPGETSGSLLRIPGTIIIALIETSPKINKTAHLGHTTTEPGRYHPGR